ncbi:MAG TPA: class I SAM-dependent methyltransferase [Deltaproteobacteria bacterium]|nr:class I SAM-dependent methyltransferase [Deltaproteobacteria bacterium]
MTDLFRDKAQGWDSRPVPAQISEGVSRTLRRAVALEPHMRVMDLGAGTGLICAQVAPFVDHVLAVDVSGAMLERLAAKPELQGKVSIHCQDILEEPLPDRVELVVSAMAMHHIEDTGALLRALHAHLVPGGRIALADLDAEDGSFHPAGTEGVFHAGFDRGALSDQLAEAGFVDVSFHDAAVVHRGDRSYPIFLVTATRG